MTERCAFIDQTALAENYKRIKSLSPHSKIVSVVKSNAYGHGVEKVVQGLEELTDAFGVSIIDEAVALRESGVTSDIVVLTGFRNEAELKVAASLNILVVIHQLEQLDYLERVALSRPVRCWLKVDTGMHRLGIKVEDAPAALEKLRSTKNVDPDVVLMSHFANADDPSDPMTLRQLQRLLDLNQTLGLPISIANSGAVLTTPEAHLDWIRPGILLYGISPLLGATVQEYNLRPVMTLKSRLISIKDCQAGDRVSYRGRWTCPEAMRVGVVAFGYGDGYPRHAQDGTPVLIAGKRAPLIGNVCMDMIMIDLRALPDVKIGDEVTLWGDGLPIEEIAKKSNTIAYELVCNLSSRVQFEIVK